jgi:integrase
MKRKRASTTELMKRNRKPRASLQRVCVYEASEKFYLKYRTGIGANRKRVSVYLCDKDADHKTARSVAVQNLALEQKLKLAKAEPKNTPVTVAAFWESVYLPFLKADKRPATVRGYVHLWSRWLAPHFGETALNAYMTETAVEFLTKLTGKLNRNSYNHVRSLMSGLFSHAIAIGKTKYGIAFNPIHDAHSVSSKIKTPAATAAYSLGELEDSISKLHEHVDAQLMLALAGFEGLRPSEIVGLKWGDITEDLICIRRAVVHGIEGDCKTPESVDDIPLIAPVKLYAALWCVKSGNPAPESWVFPNATGEAPATVRDYSRRVFKPILGDRFVGLYKARRSAASIVTRLMGNPIAASRILRHKNMNVTMTHYIENDRAALEAGMKMLEAATTKELE